MKSARLVSIVPGASSRTTCATAPSQIAFSTLEELGDVVVPSFDPHVTDVIDDD